MAYYLAKRSEPALLSLVFPIFNEEESIRLLRQELCDWSVRHPFNIEVILVDDGSTDRSLEMLRDWAVQDNRIRILSFSRNFGHQAAVTAGLQAARGEAVVILDADLQDPLDVIPEMVARYCDGYDVVYGQRLTREGETVFKRASAWIFYRLMRLLVHRDLPPDTGDFRLVSRTCLRALLSMNEMHRFLRGMFVWVGFPQIAVGYHRVLRRHGTTKYPLAKMVSFAWDAALSFSTTPIRLISMMGLLTAVFAFGYGVYSVVRAFVLQDTVPGWTTLVILVGWTGGMILIGLGVIGDYVARTYEAVKARPLFIIRETINLDESSQPHLPYEHGAAPRFTSPPKLLS